MLCLMRVLLKDRPYCERSGDKANIQNNVSMELRRLANTDQLLKTLEVREISSIVSLQYEE